MRRDSVKNKQNSNAYSVVSLFSGCGGLDKGFLGGFKFLKKTYKHLPFNIIWANDINSSACDTYRHNFGGEIHCGDIWNLMDLLPSYADVVIGGFPCQDVSINGKGIGEKGYRTNLYKAMIEAISNLSPRVFVAENVKGLLMARHDAYRHQMEKDFSALGYDISLRLYLAADYGVPQMRERIFIVGVKKEEGFFVPPAQTVKKSDWISTKMAIHDLELVAENKEINHIWSKAKPNTEQGNRILKADKPANTIRAECHGNIQFHYALPRRISMREAARCQSFPDQFMFPCGIRAMERQIGNAVPPVLAWHMAVAIRNCLS